MLGGCPRRGSRALQAPAICQQVRNRLVPARLVWPPWACWLNARLPRERSGGAWGIWEEPKWEEASPAGGELRGSWCPQPSLCPHTVPGFLGARGLSRSSPQNQRCDPSGTQSLGRGLVSVLAGSRVRLLFF